MADFFQFWNNQGIEGFLQIFWFYFILEFPRYVLLAYIFLVIHKVKTHFNKENYENAKRQLWNDHPLISIIVPGKDEGKNYYKLVRTLQEQTYDNFEVIIIDDGSEDNSELIGRDLERNGKIDLFLRNETRGGKASAANLALRYATGKYIVHLDADSSFNRDAIEEILVPFYEEEKVGAVGGAIEVKNGGQNLVTTFQAIEYFNIFTTGRMIADSLGILRIVSGAFGAFRRDLLVELGGWDVGPGLDGDLTLKIRKKGYKITFTHLAICLTNVPTTFTKLAKQRVRWSRSLIRFRFRKHRDLLFPTDNFSLSNFFAVVENVFFNFILNLLWWGYLIFLALYFKAEFGYLIIGGTFLYSISKIVEFGAIIALSANKSDKVKYMPYLPGMTFYVGLFLRGVRTYAYIRELFFYDSYKDAWNPNKTSRAARKLEDKIKKVFQGN